MIYPRALSAELAKKVCPRLRDLDTAQAVAESRNLGHTFLTNSVDKMRFTVSIRKDLARNSELGISTVYSTNLGSWY